MPRPHRQIAEEYGLSLQQVKRLSAKGVNVYNDEEIRSAIDALQKRPGQVVEISGEGGVYESLENVEEIEKDIAKATSLDDVRIGKGKLESAHLGIKIKKELGELMSKGDADQAMMRIGVAMVAFMDKVGNEIGPRCAGKDEAEITEEFEKIKINGLNLLANMESEFWETRKNDE